jgi:hypothetical protein
MCNKEQSFTHYRSFMFRHKVHNEDTRHTTILQRWHICLLLSGYSEKISRGTIVCDSTTDFHLDLERYVIMHRYPLLSVLVAFVLCTLCCQFLWIVNI